MSENTYFDMNRRSFLKSTAAAGALVVGTYFMGGAPRAMAGVLAKPAEHALIYPFAFMQKNCL